MRARMRMPGIDDAGRIANQPDLHAGFRILDQILAVERAPDLVVEALLPRLHIAVNGDHVNEGLAFYFPGEAGIWLSSMYRSSQMWPSTS